MSTEVDLENKVELRNVVALEVCNNGSDCARCFRTTGELSTQGGYASNEDNVNVTYCKLIHGNDATEL